MPKYLIPIEHSPGRRAELQQEPVLYFDTLKRKGCDDGPGPGFYYRDKCRHLKVHLSLLK